MKGTSRFDREMMREALRQAGKGSGATSPNPPVGAVIARGGAILSVGFHRAAGRPHAEIEALRALPPGVSPRGATIYITLEPCSSHGQTPPCTEAILQAGFKRVVYGMSDPNPAHAGRAENILTQAGLAVTPGVLQDECEELLRPWSKFILTGLPYVIAKAGMSLDGRINSHPESRWITSPASRRDAMQLRASVDAILVGGGTLREDDPQLTVRGVKCQRQPIRAVWTRSGNLPSTAQIFHDAQADQTLVLKTPSLRTALRKLAKRGVVSVLIEGGSRTLGEAFDQKLVDEVSWYLAPDFLGGTLPAVGGKGVGDSDQAVRLERATFRKLGPDLSVRGRCVYP